MLLVSEAELICDSAGSLSNGLQAGKAGPACTPAGKGCCSLMGHSLQSASEMSAVVQR